MRANVFMLNYASHYRKFIFQKIGKELNADLYFGNIPNSSIKKIDYNSLNSFKKEFLTIKCKSFFWYFGSLSLLFKPYKNFVLTGDPQILSNWIVLIFGKIFGKKIYLWTHGWYGRENGGKKFLKKTYFKLAHKLFLYGNYSRELLINEGFDPDNLIVIYNSLDYERQIEIRSSLYKSNLYSSYFKNENPILFYIGRIQESKKLDLVLQAIQLLNSKGVYMNLAIIGNEDLGYNFKRMISELNLEKQVWLVGGKYDELEIAHYIYNADLCVSPGNIGLTALHSLVYGTPIITHDNPCNQMPEFESLVSGVNGCFFEEDNVIDLAKKIEYIISKNLPKEDCYKEIDVKWNPNNQIEIFKKELR